MNILSRAGLSKRSPPFNSAHVVLVSSLLLLIDASFPFIHLYGRYIAGNRNIIAPGWDFAVFWSASFLAVQHGPASAYEWLRIEHVALPLQGLASVANMLTPWVYPPTFLLVVWPASLLPFTYAYLIFTLAGLIFASIACMQLMPRAMSAPLWLAAVAFPPVWIVCTIGQNSLLTVGLMALGLAWLERRPWLAGLCFGLLIIKPQIAILIPVALVCGRQWRAFLAAAGTAVIFCLLAGMALGFNTYARFFNAASAFSRYVVTSMHQWPTGIPTVFGTASHAGLSTQAAYTLQGIIAAIALSAMAVLWHQRARLELRSSALVIASLLCQPYLMSYDFVWMAIALLLLWRDSTHYDWRLWEQIAIVTAWVSPVAFLLPDQWSTGNIMPPVLLMLLTTIVVRHYTTDHFNESCPQIYR